jgi:hypothetical protein
MNLLDELTTDRGRVIGFGRVKFPKMPKVDFDLEVPLLSFVVIEAEYGREYVATCIHLQMDGYGISRERAVDDMISNIWSFLYRNFKNKEHRNEAWDCLYELSKSNPRTNSLWDKYHALQYHFAKRGEPDHYTELVEKINSLKNRVRELEETVDDIVDGIDNRDWRILDGIRDSVVVQYKRVERDGIAAA